MPRLQDAVPGDPQRTWQRRANPLLIDRCTSLQNLRTPDRLNIQAVDLSGNGAIAGAGAEYDHALAAAIMRLQPPFIEDAANPDQNQIVGLLHLGREDFGPEQCV